MALSSPPKKKKTTTRCSRTSGFQEKQKEINRSPYRCEHIYSGLEKSKEKATSKQLILFLCRASVYATQSELSVYLNMTFYSTFFVQMFYYILQERPMDSSGSFCSNNKLSVFVCVTPRAQIQKYLILGSEDLRAQASIESIKHNCSKLKLKCYFSNK